MLIYNILKKSLLVLMLLLSITVAEAQLIQSDVCTPNGSTVQAYITPENTQTMREYWDDYYSIHYPNATQIKTYNNLSSTRRFNCHGYAWHRVYGGSDRWIGVGPPLDDDPEYEYWEDGSYVESPISYPFPGKVVWASGDHSAVTTETSGTLISKWNEYPLMRHAWNDSPYGTTNLKHYKLKMSISGPTELCYSNKTYTLNHVPSGTPSSNIQWSVNPASLFYTDTGTGSSFSTKSSSATTSGQGTITATFESNCGNLYPIDLNVDVQETNSIYFTYQGPGPHGQLDVFVYGGSSPYYFYRNGSLIFTSVSSQPTIPFGCNGGSLTVHASTVCSSSSQLIPAGCAPYFMVVYPNPATSEINIAEANGISEQENSSMVTLESSQDTEMSLVLLDDYGTVVRTSEIDAHEEKKINIVGLKTGIYYLRILTTDIDETHRVFIE